MRQGRKLCSCVIRTDLIKGVFNVLKNQFQCYAIKLLDHKIIVHLVLALCCYHNTTETDTAVSEEHQDCGAWLFGPNSRCVGAVSVGEPCQDYGA